MSLRPASLRGAFLVLFLGLAVCSARGAETILEYFNTSWQEIDRRIPELAEAGYTALWLPQPAKGGAGSFSVGYDVLDRFDLGDKNQQGTIATRYGTKADLLRLVETAHRFGIRIYFDNIMAHCGGGLSDVPPGTLLPSTPGFVPEDFHLVKNPNGGWKKANDSINYGDEWQVLNRNPFGWDIAQETPNTSFDPTGQQEGKTYPKWTGIRQPGQTSLYPDNDLPGLTDGEGKAIHPFADKEPFQDVGYGPNHIGAGNGRFDWDDANHNGQHDVGEASEPFTDTGVDPTVPAHQTAAWGYGDGRYNMGDPVAENVNGLLIRSLRWTVDQTHCDGFRLDAVKHVPSYFFGAQSGAKDPSSAGYLGGAQAQFNLTRGFTDWANHRDSCFSWNAARDDLLFFGEHISSPPAQGDYLTAGMRIATDEFLNSVGGYGGIGGSMSQYDQPGRFTYGVDTGMMYCLSHDNNYMAESERPASHQYMLTRSGIAIVYTDGYNLSGAPDYFPKQAFIPFLGQYGKNYIKGSLQLRRDFVRGDQIPRWSAQDFCAWEFRDFSENASMTAADATTMLVMHARSYTSGQAMPFGTTFPVGARLRNYSPYNGAFYATVQADGKVKGDGDATSVFVPSGGYFAFSYDVPDLPAVWQGTSVHSIDIFEDGVQVPTIPVSRKDGKNGDPAYAYTAQIPVVRNPGNLRFVVRADGSAGNIRIKLDGGIDLNSQMNAPGQTTYPADRDKPPGTSTDTFLGYEQMRFVQRTVEKFAAQSTNGGRDSIGSPGAETWECTLGTAGFTVNQGGGGSTDTETADWVYHQPGAADINGTAQTQFSPAPANASGQPITVFTKIGYKGQGISKAWLYYTTDGTSYPEGSAGKPKNTTQVVPLAYDRDGTPDGASVPEWWKTTIPSLPAGTKLRYKIGVHKINAAPIFPGDAARVTIKPKTETIFEIANFNATTCTVYPHNDLGMRTTGLSEGFHVLNAREFLDRSNKASLYNTKTQTFYYDTQRPTGQILFPTENATIGGATYGFVVLTDASVSDVQFNILDSSAANDSATNGNGNGNWAPATQVTATQLGATGFAREWRFDYKSLPTSGTAQIFVRLREASSSADNGADDNTGWFTTLTRSINTGNAVNYRIQYPTTDGTVVDANYVAKVFFDKSYSYSAGQPIPAAQMINEFTITADGIMIPRDLYTFNRDETGSESALAFKFPNLYTGNPNDLHEIVAVSQRGDISLTDVRYVKAAPGPLQDSDGDGMSDRWEMEHDLNPFVPDGDDGPAGDRDKDGASNLLEFLYDLDPRDPTDGAIAIPIIIRNGDSTTLHFRVIPNRRFQVQTSSDLMNWTNSGPSFTVPIVDEAQWTDPAPADHRFYQVKISLF